jgi:ABC-type sugar transport system ATPase subunit
LASFLELTNISKRFGGVQALADVSLTLEAGEVHCLVGENGSGKSTLIKIISGVQAPEPGGHIVIEGREYAHLTPVESTRCGIQVIYQDLSLFPNLTVAENIAVGQHLGGMTRQHLGGAAGAQRIDQAYRLVRPGRGIALRLRQAGYTAQQHQQTDPQSLREAGQGDANRVVADV